MPCAVFQANSARDTNSGPFIDTALIDPGKPWPRRARCAFAASDLVAARAALDFANTVGARPRAR
jgi:hypothetical protein